MRKTILCAAAAAAVSMLSAGFAVAQTASAKAPADPAQIRAEIDKAVEALRKDARAGKSDILGKTMELETAGGLHEAIFYHVSRTPAPLASGARPAARPAAAPSRDQDVPGDALRPPATLTCTSHVTIIITCPR